MNMRLLILTLAIFVPGVSNAACEAIDIKNNVIVFGGNGSTTAEMKDCYPNFLTYSNIDGAKHIKCLANQIENTAIKLGEPFVIVGHSSGAVQAEQLVQALKLPGSKHKVRLILLEGFANTVNLGVATACWYAKRGSIEGMNARYMKTLKSCSTKPQVFEDSRCNTPLCLHLSLVNLKAPIDVRDGRTALATGLKNCSGNGNTEWLKPDPRAFLTATPTLAPVPAAPVRRSAQ